MPMLLRRRAGPQAAQDRDKDRIERRNLRTDQDLPPPHFWDNLSHPPLVKRALRELDRRNNTTQPPEQGLEASRPSLGDPRQLETGIKYQDISRFSRTGGPDLGDLRGYAYNPTQSQPLSERRGRRRRRSNMTGRGSSRGGRTSVSVLGKRRRNAAGESADSEYDPRTSGHSARQPKATGRAVGARIRPKDVAAARDKSTTSATTATSTKSGPYDRAFEMHLFDHNVMPFVWSWREGEKPQPASNIAEIKAEVRAARKPEPAEDFEHFQELYDKAIHEDTSARMLDILEGDTRAVSRSHVIREKKMMNNLRPLTDGTIKPGNPDRVYGAAASELRMSVRQDLEDVIVPTRARDFICPNFVVHVKSDQGDLTVARAQAAYDGALAARGMQYVWAYGNRPEVPSGGGGRRDRRRAAGVGSSVLTVANPDASLARVARTITCTWHGGTLKMYATYCQQEPAPDDGALAGNFDCKFPRYASTFIGSWNMTDEEKPFREGLAAYRNGLDWAKRQRDILIRRANARVRAGAARRRRDEEEAADEGNQSGGEGNYVEDDNYEQGNGFEEGSSSEEDDGGPTSIFARRGSGARRQDEEDEDSDPADDDVAQSFDSQRTITTRSMSRRLLER